MNVVTLIGSLGTRVRVDDCGGNTRARFDLHVASVGADPPEVEVVPVVVWGERAAECAALSQGQRVGLDGRIRSGHSIVYVQANRLHVLEPRS